MKFLALILVTLLSTNLFAAVNQEELTQALAGQWKTKTEYGEVKFLIRSSGDISVITSYSSANAQISFLGSSSDWGMNGLPVANIVISEGSDEDVWDVHLLVTAIEDNGEIKLKKVTSFTTFNDGPNEMSDLMGGAQFQRYDAKSKKWITLN